MQPDAARITLPRRLRALLSRPAAWGRLRDPAADFPISAERVTSYTAGPARGAITGPYTSEKGDYLSLHLVGDKVMAVHSLMSRSEPQRLVLGYTEIMMGFLRFVESPRTIGLIGLGGGSLVKHCYRHLPGSRITVAEISPEVIALRRSFHIPDDDERLRVLPIDGAEMVRTSPSAFDVLMIDAFDEEGYPPHMGRREFFADCHRALTDGGVLVVNLCGFDWRTWYARLDRVFARHTVLYPCPDGDNLIAFAVRGGLPAWTRE